MEIEEFASGSVFASGRSHLDFATQDQMVFILLPLGDKFIVHKRQCIRKQFCFR